MTSRSARTASTEPELSSQSASLKLWDVLFGYDGENVAMWRADFADFGAVDDKVNKQGVHFSSHQSPSAPIRTRCTNKVDHSALTALCGRIRPLAQGSGPLEGDAQGPQPRTASNSTLASMNPLKWSLFALPASLGLFFGLFFGLSYPEIVRKGWPLTTCHVLSSKLDSRYCCEKVCTAGCSVVPIGAPLCSSQISLVNNAFSPSRCASDRSTCPLQIGQVCDGGFHCCSNCCDTCQSCKKKCTGHPQVCTQSCSSSSCRCRCCSSTPRQSCTLSCPSCYSVDLTLRFGSGRTRSQARSAIYHQDFGKDEVSSRQFFNSHPVSSSSRCFYNPKNPSQVSFDVSFTPWKWAVVLIFGIVPLFLNLAVLATILGVIPAYRAINAKLAERRQRDVSETAFLVSNQGHQEVNVISAKEMLVNLEGTHDKEYSNADSDDEVPLLDAKGAHKKF